MSLICGILNRSAISEPTGVDPILAEHTRIGAQPPSTWKDAHTCLAHQSTTAVPGSANNRVIHDAESGLTITADARLDNREELLDIFDLQGFPRQRTCACELILRAFQKWGADCPQHLLGDFAFAIWDQRKQQLYAARDAFGVRPLYYHAGGEQLIFASDLKAVLAADGVPKEPDAGCFAAILGWDNPQDTDLSRTSWSAVRRLPPGHTLTHVNGRVTTSAWWKPEDIGNHKRGHSTFPNKYNVPFPLSSGL
jgi:asparagine synthase (glutamine-hydrolysing)